MKKLFLVAFMFTAIAVNAQKCKLLKPETDPFTNETKIRTRYMLLGYDKENKNGNVVNFAIIKTKGVKDTTLMFSFKIVSSTPLKAVSGSTLGIKFEDNSVVNLECIVNKEGTTSLSDVLYIVPKDNIKAFQERLVIMLRFELQDKDGNTFYSNVSPYGRADSEDLVFQVNCVISE